MTNPYQPNPADLFHWKTQWNTERSVAWSRLVATFTPEQRELLDQWNNAERQAQLCRDKLNSIQGKHKRPWPQTHHPAGNHPCHFDDSNLMLSIKPVQITSNHVEEAVKNVTTAKIRRT